jgi:predicted outer membrane repeat protein
MRARGHRWRALAVGALVLGLAAVHPAGVRAADVTSCSQAGLTSAIGAAGNNGTVQFTGDCSITLTSTIALSQSVTIDGNGHAVTISGGGTVQVFLVNPGVTVTLNDLTIVNGLGAAGGGIFNNGGMLTVTNSTLSGNNSPGGDGGGILNEGGTLTVTNSTFSGNSATGCCGAGGGVTNEGTLTVTNSTFSGNSAANGGGAIYNYRLGLMDDTLTVTNSTFSGNSATVGGGIDNNGGTANLANTILAGSTGGNCGGPAITNNGGNLADDGTCGVTQVSDTALKLGSLANNGGPTQTIALGAGSVAIDHASTNCPSTDQRGLTRPDPGDAGVTTNCDSGAYEFQDDSDLGLANVPANITVNATSPQGAVVTYAAPTATDEAGDSPAATVGCDHASGATFPIGATTVTCTATDSDDANSPVSASFTVTVTDADLAITHVPANSTTNATSSSGAVVTYSPPSATDEDGPAPAVNCDHASGATFPIGTTTVTCMASDSDDANSPVSAHFTVTVADTDLGISNVPANITRNATSPQGTVVTYTPPSAVDEAGDSPAPTVSCDHASGSTFAIGTTTVTCTASDADDTPSAATGSFQVTVKGAAAQLADLLALVNGLPIAHGLKASLETQVHAVQADLQANNTTQACGDLGAFMHHVRAQAGKKLTTAQANQLLAAATNIMHVIGC